MALFRRITILYKKMRSAAGGPFASGFSNGFEGNEGPRIFDIDPDSGSAASPPEVTITGQGFTGATSVKLAELEADSFVVDDDGTITVAPQAAVVEMGGSLLGDVEVVTGSGAAVLVDGWTYQGEPFPM